MHVKISAYKRSKGYGSSCRYSRKHAGISLKPRGLRIWKTRDTHALIVEVSLTKAGADGLDDATGCIARPGAARAIQEQEQIIQWL